MAVSQIFVRSPFFLKSPFTVRRFIWRWTRKHNLKYISDMMYPDDTIREYLFHTDQTIRSSVIEQTARWRAENRKKTTQHAEQ
jgi:hypothetical protein